MYIGEYNIKQTIQYTTVPQYNNTTEYNSTTIMQHYTKHAHIQKRAVWATDMIKCWYFSGSYTFIEVVRDNYTSYDSSCDNYYFAIFHGAETRDTYRLDNWKRVHKSSEVFFATPKGVVKYIYICCGISDCALLLFAKVCPTNIIRLLQLTYDC